MHMQASCSGRVLSPVPVLCRPNNGHSGISNTVHTRTLLHASRVGLLQNDCAAPKHYGLSRASRPLWVARASTEEGEDVQYNKEFGYSRKDVLLIGFGLIAVGYALYYAAQAVGVEATTAGNYVQLFVFLVICLGYISTYILRVANKDMTYAKQLEAYEERVMQKRLEEMPETERERLLEEVEKERAKR